MSVTQDDRFRGVRTAWSFSVISDDHGDYAVHRTKSFNSTTSNLKIHDADNMTIWVKTWGQVLDENRARMQFFQRRYAKFLQGVLVEELEATPDSAEKDDEAAA